MNNKQPQRISPATEGEKGLQTVLFPTAPITALLSESLTTGAPVSKVHKALPSHSLLPALAEIAAGRDHIQTAEFARAVNRASQTIRANYCRTGHCFGIRPIKCGNRLLWPVVSISQLLTGGGNA